MVDGDLTLGAGSVLEIEVGGQGVTPGVNNDLLSVSGFATIDTGAVLEVKGQGVRSDFDLINTYTVLSAQSGIAGGFGEVLDPFAFMDAYLLYVGGDVQLVLQRNDIDFASVAVTRNQRATAQALNSLEASSPLRRAMLGLYQSEAPEVFDALSGELHASTATALAGDARQMQQGMLSRLSDRSAPGADPQSGASVWLQAYGAWGDYAGTDGVRDLESEGLGAVFGADTQLASGLTLGVAGGYVRSSYERQGFSASVDADSYFVGAYAGAELGAVALRLGASYGDHGLSTQRRVAYSGLTEQLVADYDASSVQAGAEASWVMNRGGVDLEPFASLDYLHLDSGSVKESGGVASLTGAVEGIDAVHSTLGLRAGQTVSVRGVSTALTGQLGWRHAYGDISSDALMAFEGGELFQVSGVSGARDAAQFSAGARMDVSPSTQLSVGYSGLLGDRLTRHGVQVRMKVGF